MRRAEPVTSTAPRPVRHPFLTQGWRDVAFLHWALDPEPVAPLFPAGTVPDTHDGATYVGPIPFRMLRIGLLGAPGLPYLGSFAETNVRLHSLDEQERRGVVFPSLDADRLLPVLAARWVARLPQLWSRMRVTRAGDERTYTSRRRWPGPTGAHSSIRLVIGERLARTPIHWPGSSPDGGGCTDPAPRRPRTGPTSTRSGRSTGRNCSS